MADIGATRRVVIDDEGYRLLWRRMLDEEATLSRLVADVVELSEVAAWAIDPEAGGAALVISLLTGRDQPLLDISGRVVRRAAGMYLMLVIVDEDRETCGCGCGGGSPAPVVEDGLVHHRAADHPRVL